MFDFDNFINGPCIKIFGHKALITPANKKFEPFEIEGDFHENYQAVNSSSQEIPISSEKIIIFIRTSDLPPHYNKLHQGDYLKVKDKSYQIIDIQTSIPGSSKVILHESSKIDN